MSRSLYRIAGIVSVALGVVGIALPLLPTTPFLILAAYCFARSDPAWERRMLEHPRIGPTIRAWRAHGAIPRPGKIAATGLMAISAAGGLLALSGWMRFVPIGIALPVLAWIWSRPDR